MKRKNNNILDYLDWRGDLTFKKDKFNEVDGLIMSCIVYVNLECASGDNIVSLPKAAKILYDLPDEIKYDGTAVIKSAVEVTYESAKSNRYKGIKVSDFINIIDEEKEMQFAAATFSMPDGSIFVAFRGTDNTLVGWKEDFNMSFSENVPSQLAAAEYLAKIAKKYQKPMRIGGHSKGGNLSVWAAAHLPEEYKEKIITIYSNDAPGFRRDFLDSQDYKKISEKIQSFVPESSIIGVLMEYDEFNIISSSSSSFAQHMPLSWRVSGTKLVRAKGRTKSGNQIEKLIKTWRSQLSEKERKEFVESAYSIILSSNAKKLDDLDGNKLKSILAMHKSYRNMEPEKQKQLILGLSKMMGVTKQSKLSIKNTKPKGTSHFLGKS